MKRSIILICVLFFAGSLVFAQSVGRIDLVAPKNPRVMGMGGAFVAMSDGYASFFGNPAAFASKKGELTLSEATVWLYVPPTNETIDMVSDLAAGSDDFAAFGPLLKLATTNGIGGGASSGFGWVGRGLALGAMVGADTYVYGRSIPGAAGSLDIQATAVLGLGIPINLLGLKFSFGGSLRPYLRTLTPVSALSLVSLIGSDSGTEGGGTAESFDPDTLIGFGLAADLGVRLDLTQSLAFGLAIRDISTKQKFSVAPLSAVMDKISSGDLSGDEAEYEISPNITAGVQFKPIPTGLRKLLDVDLIAEIQDPIGAIRDKKSFMNTLHAGAEASLLNGLIAVRGGINRGWLSVGAGIDLLFIETNVAFFTEEMGKRPGDRGRSGLSMDLVLRF